MRDDPNNGCESLFPQDEPVKYYAKYMTKPPLFPSESERQSRQQKPQTAAAGYREMIEIQKKNSTERDDRQVSIADIFGEFLI